MIPIMAIYGTRPEGIKMAPLIQALQDHPTFSPFVLVSGQHREMLDQVNNLYGIKPALDLDLMVPGASLGELASRTLASVTEALVRERPEAVVVQGDTSTAFISALAAFYEGIPVIHLEAGLRTGDLSAPFPEEANRLLTARITALHLAPTSASMRNLVKEAVDPRLIAVTGNTVIDALNTALHLPVRFGDDRLARWADEDVPFVLVTAHRRESWGEPMRDAMRAVREVAGAHPEVRWILPMHKNPVVRDVVQEVLTGMDNVLLIEPLNYHEFCHVMRASRMLLTDSGGVQEEAPSLGKPVLVMRDTTERPEAVEAGTVKLVGTTRARVRANLLNLIENVNVYEGMASAVNPYGDGRASERAIAAMEEMFNIGKRMPDFIPTGD